MLLSLKNISIVFIKFFFSLFCLAGWRFVLLQYFSISAVFLNCFVFGILGPPFERNQSGDVHKTVYNAHV